MEALIVIAGIALLFAYANYPHWRQGMTDEQLREKARNRKNPRP